MLRLLFCTVFIAPCLALPFSTSFAESPVETNEMPSVEEVYIAPELELLNECKSAELDIFFHDEYITTHSAEFIAESLLRTQECEDAVYTITPIIPASSNADDLSMIDDQGRELSNVLEDYGITAKVADADVQTEFNTLSANGRTAKLKIVFDQGDDA